MKIAFFHELHQGGARRSVNEFGKRLKKKHQVDLYIVDEIKNDKEDTCFNTIHFYQFHPKKWSGGNWKVKLYKDTIELYKLYKLHKKISEEINAQQYDVVLIDPSRFTQAPFILRFLTTKKIYYCQESLRMVYEPRLAVKKDVPFHKYMYEKLNRFVRKHVDRSNFSYADVVIANSQFSRENLQRIYQRKCLYSYMGVDTQVFTPIRIKKDIDILFVGSYADDDGYPLLKEAIPHLPADLTVKVLASEKQWITNDIMIRELYCRAKIALALAHNEPFGLIPIEAMACGVPIIAVNEGGYKETVVDGKTGYLIRRDPSILAKKVQDLLSHPDKLELLSKNARKQMQEYWDWEKTTKSLEKILS